ncbi:amine sulfotransferase-like [Heterodontus francisci]|uniref:amine sulfotransferase-like n=1 Tax=Heterodontus francisci TaxID=7792 RepID=UPI00355C7395
MDNNEENKQTFEYFQHNGIPFVSGIHSIERLEWLKDFKMDPDIPLIVTYPKSGTNWMQQIASLIMNCDHIASLKEQTLYQRAPWMEYIPFKPDITKYMMLTTHLNYHMVPNDVKNKMIKIIYVVRNPKDVIVSSYYFHQCTHFLKVPKDFQDFLKQFVEGNVFYGSWFDHIRDWYNHKDELNILIVMYEDMQKDLRSVIEKIASFLNKELDGETLELILDQCTFKYMKENPETNYQMSTGLFKNDSDPLFRKGVAGDWKNHFLVSQSEWFDSIYQERMADFPLKFESDIVTNKQ